MRPERSTTISCFCTIALSVVPLAFMGCGNNKSSVGTVHGKVMLNDKPLANGTIVTRPNAGRGSQGIISNGEFELGTFSRNDGALIGTHQVAIIAEEKRDSGAEAKAGKLLIPQRYTNPDTSGLAIEVKPGDNTPELILTSP
jgi:hypothetical protein